MSYVSLEQLSKGSSSYYKLVLLAADRANQILHGDHPLIETSSKKHTTIALSEIAAGKVRVTGEN